jgi:hypothetical protein
MRTDFFHEIDQLAFESCIHYWAHDAGFATTFLSAYRSDGGAKHYFVRIISQLRPHHEPNFVEPYGRGDLNQYLNSTNQKSSFESKHSRGPMRAPEYTFAGCFSWLLCFVLDWALSVNEIMTPRLLNDNKDYDSVVIAAVARHFTPCSHFDLCALIKPISKFALLSLR